MPMSPRLLRPRAAGGFDPRAIAGLSGWYSMAKSSLFQNTDGTTPATAENDPVGYVSDLSGNGRHLLTVASNGTQVNASRPQLRLAARNGRAALSFDGVNDYITHNSLPTGGTDVHVFVVTSWTVDGNVRAIVDNDHGNTGGFVIQSIAGVPTHFGLSSSGSNAGAASLVANGQWRVLSGHTSSSANSIRTNGGTLVTQNTVAAPVLKSRFVVGAWWQSGSAGRTVNATVSEVVIYHAALNATQIAAVSDYLMREYGI